MTSVKILVDHRELRNDVAKKLYELGVEIETATLEVGDFLISEDVVVELKKVPDFVNSLIDGRLFSQALDIKRNFKRPLYILEGDPKALFEVRNIHPNAVRSALAVLATSFQLPIIFSSCPDETAEYLALLAKREQLENNKEVSLRGAKQGFTLAEQQQFFIEGLPSIGPSLAKALLKKFKTPKKLVNAKIEQLMKTEGVGEKKAKKIREILDGTYSEEPASNQKS